MRVATRPVHGVLARRLQLRFACQSQAAQAKSDAEAAHCKACGTCVNDWKLTCGSCNHIVAPPSSAGPFDVFGLPARFALDGPALQSAHKRMQMRAHPDRFAPGAGGSRLERAEAEAASAALSSAFRVLESPWSRAHALLLQRGRDPLAENAGTARSGVDAALLMEVMEAREVIDSRPADPEQLKQIVDAATSRLSVAAEELGVAFATAEEAEAAGDDAAATAALERAEALVVEAQYRQRIKDQAEAAAEAAQGRR
ncbi:hypothetical protein FNF28_03442 [Cafeteria roenbergensis]|uniref:Co-chaperone HscB C-terminal oligomerisation domain-containing protein n=1 Tax=Cafeteria roenbergensis TaxID=33653 RepID=A0A5A8DNV8_CAFRO|nr:hypothetical protein FNF28_03442 [Cafeteria roenbergensis]